jgi:hypothetical protein
VTFASFGQDTFNVQNLTPSSLLPAGKWEVKSFNSNYTQTAHFDQHGDRIDNAGGTLYNDDGTVLEEVSVLRNTFFNSVNQVNYGLNSKINVGLEFWLSSGALSSSEDSRLSSIMFDQTAHTRTAMSYIGAKIKFVPISSLPTFSVQSAFLIPIAENLQSLQSPQPFLNWDTYIWTNQFFLDIPLKDKWLLFLNVDLAWGIGRNETVDQVQGNRFTMPAKVLLNYFANRKLTFLLQGEYNRIWQAFGNEDTRKVDGAYYLQMGPSIKYQLIPGKFEGEIGYNYFLAGNNGQGAGNSINLGVRILL